MSLLLAIAAALAFAIGTFLTKGVTLKISIYRAIGPLFILNALFVFPLIPFGPRWILWTGSIPYLHILGALGSGIVAGIIFTMVSRSTASVVSVGQAITPAVVLLAGPIALGTSIVPVQVLAIVVLVFATLFPLRKSLVGVGSFTTIFLMITIGVLSGLVTVAVVLLNKEGVGTTETFIVRQLLAGFTFMAIFPPIGLHWRDFMQLVRRSFFMSVGWLASIYAIRQGSPVVVQSVMATIPLWVILIEVIAYKERPSRPVVFSAIAIAIGIYVLALTS
ncbi:MAG: DMT family transporter [Actinobacteria bacterium]|nr:DMT family transporter [Actinomycetota bacterium]